MLEDYLTLYPEVEVPPDQMAALMDDRMGCMLGAKIAERLRKKVGDRLVLRSTIWTQKNGSSIWEFNVRALYTTDSPTFDQTMMLFHFKRFDEARQFGQGSAGLYFVGIADPGRSAEVSAAIDTPLREQPVRNADHDGEGVQSAVRRHAGQLPAVAAVHRQRRRADDAAGLRQHDDDECAGADAAKWASSRPSGSATATSSCC